MTVIRDYHSLVEALDDRRKELGLPMLAVDFASGCQDGYTAKLIAGRRTLGPVSLGLLLEALGVELLMRPRNMENLNAA